MVIGKRCIATGLLTLGILSGMTGCQTEKNMDVGNADSNSGTSVSAEVSQADFWTKVDEKLGNTERHFPHNGMVYFAELQDDEDYDGDDKWTLVQQGSDGIRLGQYEIPEMTAVWEIADDWLYYTTRKQIKGDDTADTLWRVPIRKTEKGETLLLDQKEKLVTMSYLVDMYESIYVSDSCLIFEGRMKEEDANQLYKYDLHTKKCAPLSEKREFARGDLTFTSDHELAVFDGQLFIQTDKALYSLEPESGRMTWLMDKERENYVTMEQCGDSMYITTDHRQIYRYDGEGKEPVCVISKDIFHQKLEELQLWGDKGEYRDHEITDVYAYEDRLYFSVTADWSKKKTPNEWNSMFFILLHADIGNIEELGFEDRLWDPVKTIWENNEGSTRELSDDDPLQDEVYGPCMTGGIVDGKMIVLGDEVVPAYVSVMTFLPCMAYDLDTGEIMENPAVKIRGA